MCDIANHPRMQHLVVLLPVLHEALGLAWVLDRIP